MKKEEIYVNLQGKTREELTDLWEFLKSNGEECFRDKEYFLEYTEEKCYFGYDLENFCNIGRYYAENKTEVTIEQLKQIIKPTLQQQLQKAEAEVKSLQCLIEEENKPKIGLFYNLIKKDALIGVLDSEAYLDGKKIYTMVGLPCIYHNFEPMDKQQLIEWYDERSTKN